MAALGAYPAPGSFPTSAKKPTKAALLRPASKITLTGTFATPCGGLLGLLSEVKVNDEHLETVGSRLKERPCPMARRTTSRSLGTF